MARLGRNGFIAIAVVFHLIYIYSIFDIYFVSPIVSGMRQYASVTGQAPAKRLVLYVGDGLRADKAFQSFPDPSPDAGNTSEALTPRPLAPFLRSRVLNHGTFGVSHTRVPTESRPGHVALIAGLYEDVSAVTTGWKLNPVNFDSVFNRSRHTWSWGSPDILPMFQYGSVPGRVDADTYGAEAEDFTSDATQLDIWVFDRVKELFAEAQRNQTLNSELRQDKIVFFLHLLGLDTTGHGFRPYSKEYLHNIQVVDKGVKEVTELIERFYGDDDTAFVFTADHGMSDWGSHGDGHPDNTRTPLIAWGSGVAKPSTTGRNLVAAGHEDGFSSDWNLDQVARHDVAQADVAALMAFLVGLDFPVNSVGELPLPYVSANPHVKASALLANAQSILEMYRVKETAKKNSVIGYKPYVHLSDAVKSVDSRVGEIEALIADGQYEAAVEQSQGLIKLSLDGMRYLQTYDWLFLRTLVTVGYLGWIAFALTTVIDTYVLQATSAASRTPQSVGGFAAAFVALCAFMLVQRSPWTYYAYAIFPVIFWEEVYARREALVRSRDVLLGTKRKPADYGALILSGLAFVGLLEAIVQSYFHREIYTICYLAAITWPLFYGLEFVQRNALLVAAWAVSCATMASFTLLPVIKTEDLGMITSGGALMFAVGLLYVSFGGKIISSGHQNSASAEAFSRAVLGVQIGLIGLAMAVTQSSVASLQAKQGLPLGSQVVGWAVMILSLTMPFLHRVHPNNHYVHRLVVIFLTFSPAFVILTISYEGLFYFCFCAMLALWVQLEHRVYQHTTGDLKAKASAPAHGKGASREQWRGLTLADARISLFFLFLLQSAFFSTGNIASISSFSLEAVSRLIPVFDPFSQGALLMLKIMIPFAVISANLGILNRRLGVAPSALFLVVMAISDVLTLNFFYMVRDEGSWLDIGTTISHFCIASMLCVFVAGLEFVSELFVSGVEIEAEAEAEAEAGDEAELAAAAALKKSTAKAAPANGRARGTASASNGTAKG